jgi:hypothetical protein
MIRRLLALASAAACVTSTCLAEKPDLDNVYPTAAARGQTNTINLAGKFEPWPPKFWCSTAGVDATFPTNKNKLDLVVSADAKAGPCLLRVYNDEGASDPIIFVITDKPQLPDTEPNNHFAKAQALTNLPVTINGRLDKNNDVDSFAFPIKAGQWLDAKVESHTLMSKIDAVLRLVTTNGYQLAWNHDFASFDPRIIWQAPYDQTVILQVFGFLYPANSEIALSGGNGGVYQLSIITRTEVPKDLTVPLNEDAKLSLTNCPKVVGAICPAGDEDKYPIQLKKDDSIEVRVDATEFGSDLDPWVKITDAAGKELARNDDAEGSSDAVLEWKAPADGEFNVVIGSVTHAGDESWRYRLQVEKVAPDFRATVEANSFVLESRGTNEVKVGTKRLRGLTNELSIAIEKLPEGLAVEPVKVDAKGNEATLKLITKDAAAFNAPIKILVKDEVTGEQRPAIVSLVTRSENNGVPAGYSKLLVEQTEDLWLTIKPPKEKPAEKPADKPAQ